MQPFEQGALDSLCGIYSIVNANRIINKTSREESEELFQEIIHFLSRGQLLEDILIKGMFLKDLTKILDEIIGESIPVKKLYWRNKATPALDEFWTSIQFFLTGTPGRAVILCLRGVHDHWTVIERITSSQIDLHDSAKLKLLRRAFCTTAEKKGKRKHILRPAQTYFLSRA